MAGTFTPDFDRVRFERGLMLFGTLLVKIGIASEQCSTLRMTAEAFADRQYAAVREHIATLSLEDLHELMAFIDSTAETDWATLMLVVEHEIRERPE